MKVPKYGPPLVMVVIIFVALCFGIHVGYYAHRCRVSLHTLPTQTEKYTVTAYCHNECCCEEWADGFFANGEPVGGLAIAAPKSVPFGTVLFIRGYGTATVKDRGGSITGNRFDVYFPTHQEALDWGIQYLNVLEIE